MEPVRSDEAAVRAAGGLVTRAVEIPVPSLRAVFRLAESPRTVWAAPGEPTVVGSGAAAVLTVSGPDRFSAVRDQADGLFSSGNVHAGTEAARPRLFGGFAFHDDHESGPPWTGYPSAQFVLPALQVTYTDGSAWLTVNAVDVPPESVVDQLAAAREQLSALSDPGSVGAPPGIASRERTTGIEEWREGVRAAVDRIEAGELQKVVLAQALGASLEEPLALEDALSRLSARYPDCYRFLVEPYGGPGAEDGGGPPFFGASPERLVKLRGRTVETGALAGTTGRGDTPTEDEWLARELLTDEKNVHEHELVVEAIGDQLAPLASSVATGERSVRRLATVQHLHTPVTAELVEDDHVLSLVEALHPTPAVGGLPPDRAMSTIRETEPFDRGWYAAPVGWFDAAGYGSFTVALRSAVAGPETATLFAGVGIVDDSDPDREWDEVQLKYRPILDVLE